MTPNLIPEIPATESQGLTRQVSSDFPHHVKLQFEPQVSDVSGTSTTHSLEELSSPDFYTRCCSEIDAMTVRAVYESSIRDAIQTAWEVVAGGQFCVTVADPRLPDLPLIAVSDKSLFESITGFSRSEVLGNNCRFLNVGCLMDPSVLIRLRLACETGGSFAAVLQNRRKSGELFLNLLDLRGLTVARNQRTSEELWFLVGIQADVTHLADEDEEEGCKKAESLLFAMQGVANDVRMKLADKLSALAVAGALMSNFELAQLSESSQEELPDHWCLLASPIWRRVDETAWPEPLDQFLLSSLHAEKLR